MTIGRHPHYFIINCVNSRGKRPRRHFGTCIRRLAGKEAARYTIQSSTGRQAVTFFVFSGPWYRLMKSLTRIYDEKKHYVILTLVVFAAFAVRLAVIFFTIYTPSDGPGRTTKAYVWSQSPYFQTHGNWLPGYMYLVGTFGFLFENPLLSSRLVNAVLGTLTVLLIYILIRKVYDPMTALISSSLLAFFPLHIGLSAAALTEVSFAFEVIAGTLFFIMAAESEAPRSRALYLVLALFFLCLAGMTRYEAWVLIPVFPVYYFWKRRKISESVLITAVLLVFPFIWTLNNYLSIDAPFLGFTRAGLRHGRLPVNVLPAIRLLMGESIYHLGWIVPILAVIGIALQFLQAVKRAIDANKMLYIVIVCIFWAGVFAFTLARGAALWTVADRYLLFAFITALPFSALPLTYYSSRHKKPFVVAMLLAVTLVVSVVYKPQAYKSLYMTKNPFYVTLWQPAEMKDLAEWLKNSPYRESYILMTRINGQSAYLSLYFPEAGSRRFIVKVTARDSNIQRFLKSKKPSLLISDDGDVLVKSRIEDLLGRDIGEDRVVHTVNHIKVYDITSAVN